MPKSLQIHTFKRVFLRANPYLKDPYAEMHAYVTCATREKQYQLEYGIINLTESKRRYSLLKNLIVQITDRSSMETLFDKLYTARQKRPPLKALIVYTELEVSDLERMISSRRKLRNKYFVKISSIDSHLYLLNIRRIIRNGAKSGFALLDTSHEGAWILFTNEGSYFVAHVLERMFEGLYPEVSRFYLNYTQMNRLLTAIEKDYKGQKTVTFFVTRREPMHALESLERRGTFLLWERRGEEELLAQMDKYRITVEKLDFLVRDANRAILLQAHIARKGLFKLRFGNFGSFYKNVVNNAVIIGFGLKRFHSYRQRMEKDGDILLSPIQISYNFGFNKEQLATLANEISKSYSTSIIHAGNPYFAANVCDYQDGTSFGITALGKKVTIAPISRATPSAVWKLTNKIQELLGDGELSSIVRAEGHH